MGIGYSAGGLIACRELLAALPREFGLPILVVQHFSSRTVSLLPEILSWSSGFPAKWATDNEQAEPGTIYVAPPDYHLVIGGNHWR